MSGYVYLICDPATDTYKIGVTKRDINVRLRELQTGNPTELFIVNYYKCDEPYKLEHMLHTRYKMKGALNEWYSLDSEDVAGFISMCENSERIIKSLSDNIFYKL